MIARDANKADLPAIVALLGQMHASLGLESICAFDEAFAKNFVISMMQDPQKATVLVADHGGDISGVLAGVLIPIWFCPSSAVVQELIFWVSEKHRGQGAGSALIDQFEKAAETMGARFVGMSSEPHRSKRNNKLFLSLGYRPQTQNYLKEVSKWAQQ